MADSSQKILRELSDLTRNLDVLAKEIRGMNKNTALVQDAVAKSVEKKESASDKSGVKESTPDAGKVISETKKTQDSMFSRLLETIRKSSEAGNNEIKKAGIEGIKNAGKTLLETKSLKNAAKAGIGSILNSSKGNIIEAIRKKKEEKNSSTSEGVTKTEGLKEKERVKKEEESVVAKESLEKKVKESEKKEKKSILEKLNIKRKSKEEKIESSKEKTSEEKVEKKSLLSKIKGKIFDKDSKKEDALPDATKEKNNTEDPSVIRSNERKELPSLKSITNRRIQEENPEGRIDLKERSKQIFQKTTLGSTIKSFSDAVKKRKSQDMIPTSSTVQNQPEKLSVQSKIEKIGTELKSRFKSKKKESPAKEKSETPLNKEVSTPVDANKPKESKESEKISSGKSMDKNKESGKGNSPEISAQDIADIKSLLASINSTLNGPLNIKDNKPYRPQSNMLKEF